jgi:uncharacterized protein (DUF1697 family)
VKYVALLRGINVGGNSVVKMADLKSAIETCGFERVRTFIQSGNLIFDSEETDAAKIAGKIEKCLMQQFKIESGAVVLTTAQLQGIVNQVPDSWNQGTDLRKYIAFIKPPMSAREAVKEFEPRAGVDSAAAGDGVIYMSTLLSGITKTGFTKLIGKPVYKTFTLRNFATVERMLKVISA